MAGYTYTYVSTTTTTPTFDCGTLSFSLCFDAASRTSSPPTASRPTSRAAADDVVTATGRHCKVSSRAELGTERSNRRSAQSSDSRIERSFKFKNAWTVYFPCFDLSLIPLCVPHHLRDPISSQTASEHLHIDRFFCHYLRSRVTSPRGDVLHHTATRSTIQSHIYYATYSRRLSIYFRTAQNVFIPSRVALE
jgi:hypothetical protein